MGDEPAVMNPIDVVIRAALEHAAALGMQVQESPPAARQQLLEQMNAIQAAVKVLRP